MILPNTKQAYIPLDKLAGYSLNPRSPRGKHKARVFQAALGLGPADADWLRDQILAAVLVTEAIESDPSPYGERYVVDFSLSTDVGTAIVRTAWIIRQGESIPRMTTCYVR